MSDREHLEHRLNVKGPICFYCREWGNTKPATHAVDKFIGAGADNYDFVCDEHVEQFRPSGPVFALSRVDSSSEASSTLQSREASTTLRSAHAQ